MERAWRYRAGGPLTNPPVAGGGRLYLVTESGDVHAVDPGGNKLWSTSVKPPSGDRSGPADSKSVVRAPPLYAHGAVLVGTRRGVVRALEAKDGAVRWRRDLGKEIFGSVNLLPSATPPAVVAVTQPDGVLHALNLRTGEGLWTSKPTNRTDGSPAVADGRIAYGNCDAAVYLFDAGDGRRRAKVPLGPESQAYAGVASVDGQVYAGDRAGTLTRIDTDAGKVVWQNPDAQGEVSSTPAVAGDRVVFTADDGAVYAADRVTGKTLWRFPTPGRPSSPVIAGHGVLVSADGTLYLLGLADGQPRWSAEVGDQISSPAVAGGLVLVGSDEGFLTAFRGAGLEPGAGDKP